MAKFAVDTNILIDALRSPAERVAYQAFVHRALSHSYMSAVVGMELIAGATSARHAQTLDEDFLGPFRRRGRLFGPSTEGWLMVGRILARLPEARHPSRSLVHDLLIAVSCREHGIMLVTRDRDFRQWARYVPGLQVREPYPS